MIEFMFALLATSSASAVGFCLALAKGRYSAADRMLVACVLTLCLAAVLFPTFKEMLP